MIRVPIVRDERSLCWVARCDVCKELLYLVTDEAVLNGPRRTSGTSLLLPVLMSVRHVCFGPS